MFTVDEEQQSIKFVISSAMRQVDRVVQSARAFLESRQVLESSEFNLVLRELLINAVEHGNRSDESKTISGCVLDLGNRRFQVTVEDQGPGFDYKALTMTLPTDPRHERKRGYGLINAIADEIVFAENGRKVTVFVTVSKTTEFALTDREGCVVVTPSGDLTAESANRLRLMLIERFDQGARRFRFDLAHVMDLDSVSLSVLIGFSQMLGAERPEMVNINEGPAALFRMTRMDRMFKLG